MLDSLKMPKVCIILVNWNGWEDTVECLHSLQNLNYEHFSVIVVDNASTDNSVKEIKDRFNKVTLIENSKNQGFAGGNNRGIECALDLGAEYVWLLNNDTVVEEKALEALINRTKNHPEIGICGSQVIYYDHRATLQALGGGTYNKWLGITRDIGQNQSVNISFDHKHIEERLHYIAGASMLVSKTFINAVGLLDEEYFLYYEEIDWAIRAKGAFKLGYAPESIVYHKEGASIGASNLNMSNKSRLADYYYFKSKFKITYKYYPWFLPVVFISTIYSIFNRMKRNQWDRIPMIIKLFFTFNRYERY